MYIGPHVKYRYYCQVLVELDFFPDRFWEKKYGNIKFYENRSSGWTDVTKLVVAYRNFCERALKCNSREHPN